MNTIPYTGKWKDISSVLNDNFALLGIQLEHLSDLALYCKGRFQSSQELVEAHPAPMEGSYAYVGTTAPYAIYLYTNAKGWYDSGETGEPNEFDWSELPIADDANIGLMTPSHVMKVNDSYDKLGKYAPNSIVVMSESELEAMAEAGTLEDGILYLGTEEEEL